MTNAASLLASDTHAALTVDFLSWLAREPRFYNEVMDAWRTSCPRLSVWEDSVAAGLVNRRTQGGRPFVEVTQLGSELLAIAGHRL